MNKSKYKCKICGYSGEVFIFEFSDFTYCLASNSDEPEYIGKPPKWVKSKGLGEAKIGEIIGCPKCRSWGKDKFELIEENNQRKTQCQG